MEREAELDALLARLGQAADGEAATAVIDGPAGIGKTALLKVLIATAREREMTVLSARATPLERHFSYAVARQLFDPLRAERPEEHWQALLDGAARARPSRPRSVHPRPATGAPTWPRPRCTGCTGCWQT